MQPSMSVIINISSSLTSAMPSIDAVGLGHDGRVLLVDRSSGCCIATSSWDSAEAMRASNELLQPVRQRLLETLSGDVLEVQEWRLRSCTVTTSRLSGPALA